MPRSSVESRGHHRRSTAAAARFAVMGVAVAAVAGASDVGTRCPAVRLCRGARIQGAHAARASKVLARDSPQKVVDSVLAARPKLLMKPLPDYVTHQRAWACPSCVPWWEEPHRALCRVSGMAQVWWPEFTHHAYVVAMNRHTDAGRPLAPLRPTRPRKAGSITKCDQHSRGRGPCQA